MAIIAVDAGKHSTKAIMSDPNGNERVFTVRTKIEDYSSIIISKDNTYDIEYNGKRYILGNEASSSDYDTSKTKLAHKLAAYVAIAILLYPDNVDYCIAKDIDRNVDLVTGCPISQFTNKETRNEYVDYLKEKNIHIKINERNYGFSIDNVLVLPESIGVVIKDATEYVNGSCNL